VGTSRLSQGNLANAQITLDEASSRSSFLAKQKVCRLLLVKAVSKSVSGNSPFPALFQTTIDVNAKRGYEITNRSVYSWLYTTHLEN